MAFHRPDLDALITRVKQDILSRLDEDTLLRRNDASVYGSVLAATAYGLYGFIEWWAKQLFAHSAEAEFLEHHAHYRLGQERKSATHARGQIKVTGIEGAVIPEHAVLRRIDGVLFSVTQGSTITKNKAFITITAIESGSGGNSAAGTLLQFISPLIGVESKATVLDTGLSGGVDREADASLRSRVLEAQAAWPVYGKRGDYIVWAKQVPGITRAWEIYSHITVGRIIVLIVCDEEENMLPSDEVVAHVQQHIDALRPIGADALVRAPVLKPIFYRIRLSPAATEVKQAVEVELRELILREGAPGVTSLLSHHRQAISNAAGEWDHELISPSENISHGVREMPSFGGIEWVK